MAYERVFDLSLVLLITTIHSATTARTNTRKEKSDDSHLLDQLHRPTAHAERIAEKPGSGNPAGVPEHTACDLATAWHPIRGFRDGLSCEPRRSGTPHDL